MLQILLLVALNAPVQEAAPDGKAILKRLRPGHPRLFLQDKGLKERISGNKLLKLSYNILKRRADDLLDDAPSKYDIPDGKRLLYVSRRVKDRIYTLAFVYRMEGDRRYLDRAWSELKAAAAFKDWNPSHFLDTGEMTHAFGIGYDWLYDAWSASQRKTLRDAIIRHGLEPGRKSYRGKERYGWWVKAVHNWNQVCNGGLTIGALAIAEEEPDLCGEILASALKSIPRAMHEYAPDGGYREGPGYWGYGTTYNVLMIAALESALGTDFGLLKYKGFDVTGHFPVHMYGPSGYAFNFADCGYGRPSRAAALLWLGKRFRQPEWIRFARRYARPEALELIWYDPELADAKAKSLPLLGYWQGPQAVTMRASWTDPEATFIGFKAGRPSFNHAQADLGSFVLEAHGVRWAIDLGADNYNLRGYFDRGSGRWKFYRNRAEGHNTLVLNPDSKPDQAVRADAKIVRSGSKAGWIFAVADLSSAYDARSVRRGIALVKNRDVLVRDEVEADKEVDLYWFMHTQAKIEIREEGRTARLTKDKESLTARLLEPADARFSVLDAEPFPSSPRVKGQKSNKGVRKLTVHLKKASNPRVAVWLSPGEGKASPPKVLPLDRW